MCHMSNSAGKLYSQCVGMTPCVLRCVCIVAEKDNKARAWELAAKQASV